MKGTYARTLETKQKLQKSLQESWKKGKKALPETITTTVTILKKDKEYLREKCINLSMFIREKIQKERMKEW